MPEELDEITLEAYRAHCHDNEIEIVQSTKCGCFFCRSIFDAREVNDWTNDESVMSALCPECGVDAVIGDASGVPLSKALLKTMNLHFFGEDYIKNNPEAARAYVARYIDGHITPKPRNEELFLKYLSVLAEQGDEKSVLFAAEFYERGGQFIRPDLDKALAYYTKPVLAANSEALCQLGALYDSGAAGDKYGPKDAFECYAKAAALGSMKAVYLMSDLYLAGRYVKRDDRFAFALLEQGYDEVFSGYLQRHDYQDIFPEFNYRIAKAFEYGIGVNKDDMVSLRHYLLARYSIESAGLFDLNNSPMVADMDKEMKQLARKNKLHPAAATFDSDTFYDSFVELSDEMVPGSIVEAAFDEKEKTLHFKINFESPQILTDIAALSVGIIQGETTWDFYGISGFRSIGSHFTHIRFEGEESLRFFQQNGDDFDLVAEITFLGEAKGLVVKTKPSKPGVGK